MRNMILLPLSAIALLVGCSNDDDPPTQPKTYTTTLTVIEAQPSGGTSAVIVPGLPVEGATITRK